MELFASDKQHCLDLYCSKGKNCCYKFYLPSFRMAYGNPRFSELWNVLTKVALERSRMVLCSPDWGAHCLVSVVPCAPQSPLWGLIPGYGDT